MLRRFYANHVLANLSFSLVLILGIMAYLNMPRQQDPSINFNWIDITSYFPGAAAADVEKRVTEVLERKLRFVSDVRFVSSNSREGVSSILVRFEDIPSEQFDKRLADLRRQVQDAEDEMPEEVDSYITEITTANAFPTATVAVVGQADDEPLRRQAESVKKEMEQVKGIDRLITTALAEPELQVRFDPERLEAVGIRPSQLANTVSATFRDLAAGTARVNNQVWAVRIAGAEADPEYLADLPVLGHPDEVRLGDVADVVRTRTEATREVRYQGRPAVMFAVMKKENANTLELVGRINDFIAQRNRFRHATGIEVVLIDDQTEITRNALDVMQTNALLGLFLVLGVTWLFLGAHIALLTTIGIPFILAGTFLALHALGQTVNVTVLLGVVISLGMLVDDAVVVVESIYYRLQRGAQSMAAVIDSLHEVFMPVTTAVLTTMAAFLPLMLLPGILGKFMLVIPMVVTIALAISLVEAYWMLPAHVLGAKVDLRAPSRIQRWRTRALHWIRLRYTRLLLKVMRAPWLMLGFAVLLFVLSLIVVLADAIKDPFNARFEQGLAESYAAEMSPEAAVQKAAELAGTLRALYPSDTLSFIADHGIHLDFFASDPIRLFYINLEMPASTPLEGTLDKTLEMEAIVRADMRPGEVRNLISYAGQMFTETSPFFGKHYGQVLVALNAKTENLRSVDAMIEDLRPAVEAVPGVGKLNFVRISGGPPTSKPISIKVRGEETDNIRRAVADLKAFMAEQPAIRDITDDDSQGLMEMVVQVNQDAAHRAGISPDEVSRTVRLLMDGEIVAYMQDQGEELTVRVRARPEVLDSILTPGNFTLPLDDGGRIPLKELIHVQLQPSLGNIRHYNFRRTITLEADIDKDLTDTVAANGQIVEHWETIRDRYPNVDLDFSGELDDIQESLDSIFMLFVLGVGIMYLILGTQFRSYFQPFMILATVPMAFTGVVAGLVLTANPLSLYTLYGVVALAGIAVNAAIVLISTANERLHRGMSLLHATVYAARRRVIPILITSMTTVAGLFSLATGLGGKSLLWGPVATAIVWGLVVSTILTLFVIPLLYRIFMGRTARRLRGG